jgi:Tol biopolymer transport system component/DNA-binding winged helix-turn-helix (wHTH) protein
MLDSKIVGNSSGLESDGPRTLRFGLFDLDLRAGELRRNGVRVKLQEQPFQILARLLERPGDVVTREELRERLWSANTFVDFDHSLNAAIRRLRDALGDSAENPRFVETVARRGYRFLAPVTTFPINGNGRGPQLVPAESKSGPKTPPKAWRYFGAVAAIVILVAVGIRLGLLAALLHTPQPIRISELTANPADDRVRAAAISPDGRYFAFSDETGFYLRQIETGETHPIAIPENVNVQSLAWFPDSAHMVVALGSSRWRTSLWEVSALGGNARKLADNGGRPAVSPDGQKIAFIGGSLFHEQMWLMSLDASPLLKIAGGNGDFFGPPSWSPDGTMLVFAHGTDSYGYGVNGEIQIVDIRGQPVPTVRARKAVEGLDAPIAWTSNGQLLFAVAEPPPRTPDSNLWSATVDAQGRIGSPTRLTSDTGQIFTISVTTSGKRVVYLKGVPEPDVYVAKLDRTGEIDEPRRLTLDDRQDIPYDWTPDSKEVIFTSDRGGELNIYKQGIDQTIADLVVRSSHPLVESRLSSDGTQLLYVEYPRWGEPNSTIPLMRVPLAGGTPVKILEDNWVSNHQCARAPATTCVYSVANGHDLTFYTFDPFRGKGNQILRIEDDLPHAFNWSLSPDGTTLAVTKGKAESETRIRLVPLNGGVERWLKIPVSTSSLDWAADSRSLWAGSSSSDEENELLNIDLQGHARSVWRPRKKAVGWAIPSRDGRALALYVGSVSANVWMIERQPQKARW